MIKIFGKYRYHWQPELFLADYLLVFSHHANLYCGGSIVRVVLGALSYFDAFYNFCSPVWFRLSSLLHY